MKKELLSKLKKIKYDSLNLIILIVINVLGKFLVYGSETIWLNYMPPLPVSVPSPKNLIFRNTINKMIPFIIIDIIISIIYTKIMYNRNIYDRKNDILRIIIMLVIVLVILFFIISRQYSVCV